MDLKTITFEEFLCRLKKDAGEYFDCKCITEHHNDEEILLEMANDLSDFDEERANGNFDCNYEQWHINHLYLNKNIATFSYKNLDLVDA